MLIFEAIRRYKRIGSLTKIYLIGLLIFTSCSNHCSNTSSDKSATIETGSDTTNKQDKPNLIVSGIFTEQTDVSLFIAPYKNAFPERTITASVSPDIAVQSVYFSVSSKELPNLWWVQLYTKSETQEDILIKNIQISGIVIANVEDINNATIKAYSCPTNVELAKGQKFLRVQLKSGQLCINTPALYQSKPIGIQLFFRTLLCLSLLALVVFLLRKKHAQPLLIASISLFFLTMPLKISWGNYALGLMAVCAVTSLITSKGKSLQWQALLSMPVAICVIYLIGVFYTVDVGGGYRELKTIIPFLAFPAILTIATLHKSTIFLLLRLFVHAIIVFSLFSLLSYITIMTDIDWKATIVNSKLYAPFLFLYPSFSHPSFVSIIIAMAIPIAIYLRFGRAKNRISWLEMLACIGLVSTVIVLSGARIGLIVVPLLLGISILFYLKVKQWVKYLLLSAALSTTIFAYLHVSAVSKTLDDPIRDRMRTTAIAAIKEKPLFGWGTGSMKHLLYSEEVAHKAGLEKPIAEHNHFHNQYLDELVQFGFAGSLVFFGLFAYLIYLAIKRRDFLLMAYLAIYLPFMFVESPFATVKGIQPMIFWLCFLLSTQQARLCKDEEVKEP